MIDRVLLASAMGVPILMLIACIRRDWRARMPWLLPLAPMPALAAALFVQSGQTLVLPWPLLRAVLSLDQPASMLLGAVALLWIIAGIYAVAWLQDDRKSDIFAVFWLLTLTGSIGVFITADLVSFYLTFSLVSLASYGLVIHAGTGEVRRAGAVCLAFALLGEAFLLLGFVLLAAGNAGSSLLIRDVVAALPGSPWQGGALALVIAGFGLKMGLVPFHMWMPLTYAAAPPPGSAVLSGAVVKAGVIGLLRFLPIGVAWPDWGAGLVTIGFLSAFAGAAIGLTQQNPKSVLAYSSISQMGLIAAVLGMSLGAGDGNGITLVAFYATHHVMAKGALFLAAGILAVSGVGKWGLVLVPAAVVALGLGGLPLTGGALAKLAVKGPLGDGIAGTLATVSAVASSWLMTHFLFRLRASASTSRSRPQVAVVLPWLVCAAASIAIPWLLYPYAVAAGADANTLTPKLLFDGFWPVLCGIALAIATRERAPELPQGDLIVVVEHLARITIARAAALERADVVLRRWTLASTLLLTITVVLGIAVALHH